MRTMKTKGRRIAIVMGLLGVVMMIGTGIATKDRVLERWYVWKLDTGYHEERLAAARALGELHSAWAVPFLIAEFRRECEETPHRTFEESGYDDFQGALMKIGAPSLPPLVMQVPVTLRRAGEGKETGWFYIFLHESIERLYLQAPRRTEATFGGRSAPALSRH